MIDVESIDTGGGSLDARIFSDPDVYQLELERVFGRTWLFLAHETQLPGKGSFVQTYMGEDPVLVVRQRDGSIKAFLNQCRHRGMRICRSDSGTAKTFTCSYHGWSYDLEGALVSVPLEDHAYRNGIDKSRWGTLRVPRIAVHQGFVFGTWSEDVPEFEEFLGDMKYYFDGTAGRYEGGVEFLGSATKWVIDSNWKFAAEQFAGDFYHAQSVHSSVGMALFTDPAHQSFMASLPSEGRQFGGNGHGTGNALTPDGPNPFLGPEFSAWYATQADDIRERLGEERRLNMWGHATVFPNFSYLGMFHTMRVWHPRGPGQTEVWAWTVVPKNAPDEVKAAVRRRSAYAFSPAGIFETDDGETWTEIQSVLRGWKARQNTFNATMGLGCEQRDLDGYPGVTDDLYSEMASRGFYRRWQDLMLGRSWDEIAEADTRVAARPQEVRTV
ncbi:aromatic ring-hydroxylating dioxygenase subunit alpha [Streptomyces sp. NPDC090088]|uniref:aromatic ring-hydroxylating oxygenase subunit alpha n=1 Tax=Streptomyces sp. NPDC090088 TaxID=3365944 RepID=UPI0037F7E30F